jgi:hypothetical protein
MPSGSSAAPLRAYSRSRGERFGPSSLPSGLLLFFLLSDAVTQSVAENRVIPYMRNS